MPDRPDDGSAHTAARLLKGAAVLFAALGLSFLAWIGDKWIEFPEARATQFGSEAPLWPALGGFVLLAIGAIVALFWTAARRVNHGEDLFGKRHRKQPDWDPTANGEPTER